MGSLASRNVVRILKMCVWLPQEATLCKEPTPGGKQGGTWLPAGPASVTPITGHSELQHMHTHRVNKHPPPIWLLQKAWAC